MSSGNRTPTIPSSPIGLSSSPDLFPIPFRHAVAKAFNVCSFLKRTVLPNSGPAGWIPFATAMHFFNTFLLKRGSNVDVLTLASTCFFLATKVESISVKLSAIVHAAFECPPEDPDHHQWKEVIVKLEAALCESLEFNFIVSHPTEGVRALCPKDKPQVKSLALMLYPYLCMSLASQFMTAEGLAAGLLFVAADAIGCPEALIGIQLSVEDRDKLLRATVDVLAFRNKKTNVERLDAMVAQKRMREYSSIAATADDLVHAASFSRE